MTTYDYDRSRLAADKAEVKTPDLETVKAVGKDKGHFGVQYWIQSANGVKHSLNERSSGGAKNLIPRLRYKLRNEFDVPTKRVDQIINELEK